MTRRLHTQPDAELCTPSHPPVWSPPWLADLVTSSPRGDHIAFLRAINLGRHRKFPMATVRSCLTEAGFQDVETHIQTGNVRLIAPARLRGRAALEAELERVFEATTGFAVPTMAFTPDELRAVYDEVRGTEVVAERQYVAFLKNEPGADARREIEAWSAPGEGARVVGRAIHWWLDHATVAARLSNTRLEKLIGPATTRDLKVVTALVGKWC